MMSCSGGDCHRAARARYDIWLPVVQVVSDIVCVQVAFLGSYWLRFVSGLRILIPVTRGVPPFGRYFVASWAVTLLWLLVIKAHGMYGPRRVVSYVEEIANSARAATTGMLLTLASAFFFRRYEFSRSMFLVLWGAGIGVLAAGRCALMRIERALHRKGRGVLRTAIVGSSVWADRLWSRMRRVPTLGIQIIGCIGSPDRSLRGCRRLGAVENIGDIARSGEVEAFLLAPDENERATLPELVQRCVGMNVRFYVVPDALGLVTSGLKLREVGGVPVLGIKEPALEGWGAALKRFLDVVLAALLLGIASPIYLAVALSVKMGSPGPMFHKQRRVGRDGVEFVMVKFRSMIPEAEARTGPVWTRPGDTRVTRIGRILRRWSLDELPQLLNVLGGDMSLVGPRPERPHFVRQFLTSVPAYAERHRVRPGMTGWAQVNGYRGETAVADRTRHDVYYVENWSVALDIRVLLITLWVVAIGRGSY